MTEIVDKLKDDVQFRDAWWRTEGIPGSFTRLNAAKMWEYAMQVPSGGDIIEIGVDQGRSASILITCAKVRCASVLLVDSWESVLIDNMAKVKVLVDELGYKPVGILNMTSIEAARELVPGFDLIHIDANHYAPNPEQDCAAWCPRLRAGGVMMFHDYDSSFRDIKPAVDAWTEGWEDLGVWDSLAIRRKPC